MTSQPLSPPARALLRSAQAALPLSQTLWADLERGLRVPVSDLETEVLALQDAGVVLGAWLEPNPAHGGARETLVPGPPSGSALARWTARTRASVMGSGAGTPGIRWWKAGLVLPVTADGGWEPLAPEKERTRVVRDRDVEEAPPLGELHDGVCAYFATPRPMKPGTEPLAEAATALGLAPDDVRRAAADAIVTGRARRFALRASANALGWRGCGIACWKLEGADLPRAANAIAGISASMDVCERAPGGELDANLTALLLGPEPGDGRTLAERIAEQWGKPLAQWIELEGLV